MKCIAILVLAIVALSVSVLCACSPIGAWIVHAHQLRSFLPSPLLQAVCANPLPVPQDGPFESAVQFIGANIQDVAAGADAIFSGVAGTLGKVFTAAASG